MADVPVLLDAIAQHTKEFTPSQQQIAEYVVRDPARPAFMNARQVADAVGVSESSVIRFAYIAGFDGYRAFQSSAKQLVNSRLALHERYRNRPRPTGTIAQIAVQTSIKNLQALENSLSSADLERAAERIAQSRKCYVVGFRAAAGLAMIASSAINMLHRNCVTLSSEAGETIDRLVDAGPEDVLLAIAFRRYARRTLDIAAFVHERHAFVISVTDSLFSPLKNDSDVLLAGEVESPSFAYSLIAPHCIVDALVLALSQKMDADAPRSIKAWEDTFRQFHLLEGM
jgi:DNA-binding MurR/RpiR family transcriptional regulator